MQYRDSDLLIVGKLAAVYGVKGWIKLYSYTEPMENILAYDDFFIKKPNASEWQPLVIAEGKKHGKGIIIKIDGIDDRDKVGLLTHSEIAITKSSVPALEDDEFYWHQLEGLVVESEYEGKTFILGKVKNLLETGANDVIVVKATEDSLDKRERLIPYVPEQFIKQIDLTAGKMIVDWDPEF